MQNALIATALAYLLGSVPCGFLIGRLNGIDIRQHGSGNIGATNVRRTLGKKWGFLCFLLDFLKGAGPVAAAVILQRQQPEAFPAWTGAAAAGAAVCGHVWPVYLKFRGGKGVATTIGAILPLAPLAVLAAGLGWLLVFQISRFVSLASLAAAVLLPLSAWLLARRSGAPALSAATLWLLVGLAALIWLRHRENIVRLLNGTENRFAKKPAAPAPEGGTP